MVNSEMKERISAVLNRIAKAAARSGRAAADITLVGVTKTFPPEVVHAAALTGLVTHFGENRVQELTVKVPAFPADLFRPTWHLIGHLQRNKARKAAELADIIESLDSVELAETLERICAEKDRQLDVLIEVNSSGEASKTGLRPEDAPMLADVVRGKCPHLNLKGLMTIGPLGGDERAVRAAFEATRTLRDSLRLGSDDLPQLSMGMSGDFEWAIEQGSTEVRVGTAIFGHR